MKYLLDTNIVSELYKPRPNTSLVEWMRSIDAEIAYISVILLGEIRRGIEKKRSQYPDTALKLEYLLEEIEQSYKGRLLIFDNQAAHIWGKITAQNNNNPVDAQIAAIAIAHDAILVTRNIKDFKELGVKLFNPFESLS